MALELIDSCNRDDSERCLRGSHLRTGGNDSTLRDVQHRRRPSDALGLPIDIRGDNQFRGNFVRIFWLSVDVGAGVKTRGIGNPTLCAIGLGLQLTRIHLKVAGQELRSKCGVNLGVSGVGQRGMDVPRIPANERVGLPIQFRLAGDHRNVRGQ